MSSHLFLFTEFLLFRFGHAARRSREVVRSFYAKGFLNDHAWLLGKTGQPKRFSADPCRGSLQDVRSIACEGNHQGLRSTLVNDMTGHSHMDVGTPAGVERDYLFIEWLSDLAIILGSSTEIINVRDARSVSLYRHCTCFRLTALLLKVVLQQVLRHGGLRPLQFSACLPGICCLL